MGCCEARATGPGGDTPQSAGKDYYEDSNVIVGVTTTSYVTIWTSSPITGFLTGETWLGWLNLLVCNDPTVTKNLVFQWSVETSAGVFTVLENDIHTRQPVTIPGGQRSPPYERFYNITAAIDTPRIRVQGRSSLNVSPAGQFEYPRIYLRKRDTP